ncbi:hypothetical protein [Streptomyces sp. NPDC057877]|uniref:SCO2583/SCO2584 N-terminal domain-containing protein n=1 Tax=Streptomyces sp. NPDC057877 TaxID=3346269 RepID=UPI0036A3DB7B
MTEQGDSEREFDIKWADEAEHKEPSARARMLAERWKHEPPGPVPFRPEPEGRGRVRGRTRGRTRGRIRRERSPWMSVALVFGIMAAVILLLGYADFRG